MPKIVYPTLTGWVGVPPYPRFLHSAEPWDANDPFVIEHPELFADQPADPLRRSVPVEQATAAPGEQRTTQTDETFANTDALRAEYEKLTGQPADGRWGFDRLRSEVEAARG